MYLLSKAHTGFIFIAFFLHEFHLELPSLFSPFLVPFLAIRILALFSIVITLIRLCHEHDYPHSFSSPPQLTLDLNSHPVRLVCARVVLINRNHFLKPHEITPPILILTPDASLTPSVSAFHTPSSAFLTPPLALQPPSRSCCQHTYLPRLEFELGVLRSLL
jgi:hypothetical protein